MTSRLIVLAGLVVAVLLPAFDVKAQSLIEGVRRYEAGDYAGAIEEWLPLAEAGNASALFNMGQVYRLGRGVTADTAMAEVYYRRAAELGHVEAMSNLATLLYFGENAADNRAEAIALWQRAAALGDSRAQYMLGVLYFNGDGVPRNNIQAYAWTLLAIDGGSAEAVEAGKTVRKYLSEEDQREAVTLAPSLIDREAIEASRGTTTPAPPAPAAPSAVTPATQGGDAASPANPPAGSAPLLDFSRPPEALEETAAPTDTVGPSSPPTAAMPTDAGSTTAQRDVNSQMSGTDAVDAAAPKASPTLDAVDNADGNSGGEPAPMAAAASPAEDATASTTPERAPTKEAAGMQGGAPQAALGAWSVQLGAFRDVGTARHERERLSARYPDLLGNMDISILRADLGPARGVYHRLRAGAFASRAEADALCRRLIESGTVCVVAAVAAPEG